MLRLALLAALAQGFAPPTRPLLKTKPQRQTTVQALPSLPGRLGTQPGSDGNAWTAVGLCGFVTCRGRVGGAKALLVCASAARSASRGIIISDYSESRLSVLQLRSEFCSSACGNA